MANVVAIVNGTEQSADAPAVAPLDAGLLGHGVYESIRTYDGVPFAVAEHLARLADGAARLDIPCPLDALAADISRAVALREGGGETRIRLYLTAGQTRIVVADALPDRSAERQTGLAASCLPWPRDPAGPTAGIKASSTAAVRVAQRWLREHHGGATGLWVTPAGLVSEALAANVFAVVDDTLVTPPLADGPLAGVTREKVLAFARAEGIAVVERSLPVGALAGATEAFLSATSEPVVPLVVLDRRPIGDGLAGPVTRRLQDVYERRARALIRRSPPR